MALFESVENPVSLGCLHTKDWVFLWQGISLHGIDAKSLGFQLSVFA